MVANDQIKAALAGIVPPGETRNIVELGMVSEIVVNGADVMFALTAEPARLEQMEPVRKAAEEAVRNVPGVAKVMVVLTADRPAQRGPTIAQAARQSRGVAVQGVSHIIAVASGKGGVGKSTTA